MLQKKVCMLGSFAVGKTSLVAQFVHSTFSGKYLSTMGVKVDKKLVQVDDQEVNLLIWDIHGDDRFARVDAKYLRGMAGYFLIVDGTRPGTINDIQRMHELATKAVADCPFVVLVNKSDLQGTDEWNVTSDQLDSLTNRGWEMRLTSAKSGENVEASFQALARLMLAD